MNIDEQIAGTETINIMNKTSAYKMHSFRFKKIINVKHSHRLNKLESVDQS